MPMLGVTLSSPVGGLVNAQGVIDALAAGRIDVGPLDSFSHDLIERYDPARATQVRTVASTVMRPIPRRWRACSSRASPSLTPPTTTCSLPWPIAPCLRSRTSE